MHTATRRGGLAAAIAIPVIALSACSASPESEADSGPVYRDADGQCSAEPLEGVDYERALELFESFEQASTDIPQTEPVSPDTTVVFLNNGSAVGALMWEAAQGAAETAGIQLTRVDTGLDAQSINSAVSTMNARENMTLPELGSVTGPVGVLRTKKERRVAEQLVDRWDVRPSRTEQAFAQFSGGNQQKIVFAKRLRNDPQVLVLEEPTQGVDIGAKQANAEIDAAADRDVAVLVCSSDAKELARLCDRVLVLREGRISAELTGERLTESEIVLHGYGLVPASAASPAGVSE